MLKLGDFGLAIDLGKERAVTRAGTLDYMVRLIAKTFERLSLPAFMSACRAIQKNMSVNTDPPLNNHSSLPTAGTRGAALPLQVPP